VGLAAETAAAADGARREKEKASAAPSTPAAATKPEALEALEAYGTPKAQGTRGTQGIGGATATGAELEDMVPRDSETSPTPTAKSSAEGARPVSARVERVGASASAAASRSRARPSTAARPPVPVPAASSSTPRTAMPSPRLERSTAARAAVSESVMVKRAGIGKPSCIIHRRRLGVSADASAREVMDLLRVVQTKLAMGAPVASLVNVATGEELTFAAYAEAKDRAFPSGSSYLALTAAEMHAMRARPWSASPKVPKVSPRAEAPAQTLTARPISARAAARSRPLAAPSPRRLTPRALEKLEGAAETPGDRKENVPENVPKSPVAKPRVAAPESPPKPASPAAAAKALLAASPPSKAEPMQDLDANVAAPQPVVEKTVQAPQPVVEKIVPAPQPPARPEGVEEGEIVPAEQDLRDVINQSKSKKKKKNKKKK
jgi:hypothetical protein